jgi:outer membrane immunogenic protein
MNATKVRFLCSVALPVFIAAPAMAADLPVKAPPMAASSPASTAQNWSGFYVGANAGADWAYSGDPSTSASCAGAPGFVNGSYFACADIPGVNAIGTGSMSGSGFTGGMQAGYNWQFNSTVVGVEADFGAFGAKASRTATGTYVTLPNQFTISSSIDANWLFTARGRLGWAFDSNILGYVTGGLAVTHLSAANSFSDNIPAGVGHGGGNGSGAWSASATKAGWTVGAGAEYALNQNWSVRAEYLYVHFDAITASGLVADSTGAYGSAISTSTDLSAHIARAGVNYKF